MHRYWPDSFQSAVENRKEKLLMKDYASKTASVLQDVCRCATDGNRLHDDRARDACLCLQVVFFLILSLIFFLPGPFWQCISADRL